MSSHKLIENCFGDGNTFRLPITPESAYSLATTVIYSKILTFAKDISKIKWLVFGNMVIYIVWILSIKSIILKKGTE